MKTNHTSTQPVAPPVTGTHQIVAHTLAFDRARGVAVLTVGVVWLALAGWLAANVLTWLALLALPCVPMFVYSWDAIFNVKCERRRVYGQQLVAPAGPQQTVLSFERNIKVANKNVGWRETEPDRVTVEAPADEVRRMMDWIKANPTLTSRAQVMANAKVKQTTWERVMDALREVGAVEGGGKSGYTVTDVLDEKLDRLEARL